MLYRNLLLVIHSIIIQPTDLKYVVFCPVQYPGVWGEICAYSEEFFIFEAE